MQLRQGEYTCGSMDLRHNIPLAVGLMIPVLMILFVAGAIYLPAFWAEEPQYDFLYAVGSYPTHATPAAEGFIEQTYVLSGGRLTVQSRVLPQTTRDSSYPPWRPGGLQEPRFYVHDTATNTSREATAAEVQALTLEAEQTSPDGFEVVRGGGGGGWPFGGSGNYDKRFLRGQGTSEELNIKTGTSDYWAPDGFQFIGWIVE